MKKINKLILVLIMSIIGIINVSAFASSIGPISQSGSPVKTNVYDKLPLKYYDNVAVFCTNFHNENIGGTCTPKNNWSDEIKVGVASIIDSVGNVTISGNAPNNYYYGELAINEFLCKSGIDTTYTCISDNRDTATILGSYYSWYQKAVQARDNYKDATISFSSQNLNFSLSGYYYISNEITVTKSFDDNYTVTTNNGEVVKSGNTFKIKVPASSVTAGNSVTITAQASISKKVRIAQNYNCGDNQSVTPKITEEKTLSASATASGTITVSTGTLTIKKVDEKGNYISGAKIKVENSDKSYSREFTTTNQQIVIENLALGTYTVTELEAATGYNLSKEAHNVSLQSNKLTDTVVIINKLTETVISKKSAVNGEELPGATLEILNENKEKMSCTILDADGNKKELEECSWISTKESTKVVGLPKGKYFLRETIAPEGYELSASMVEFEVLADGSVKEVEMINELQVEVPNTLSARSALLLTIAMIDIALGIGIITYVKKNKLEQ